MFYSISPMSPGAAASVTVPPNSINLLDHLALKRDQTLSMGLRSPEYNGRYRAEYEYWRRTSVTLLEWWAPRLSMTTTAFALIDLESSAKNSLTDSMVELVAVV